MQGNSRNVPARSVGPRPVCRRVIPRRFARHASTRTNPALAAAKLTTASARSRPTARCAMPALFISGSQSLAQIAGLFQGDWLGLRDWGLRGRSARNAPGLDTPHARRAIGIDCLQRLRMAGCFAGTAPGWEKCLALPAGSLWRRGWVSVARSATTGIS